MKLPPRKKRGGFAPGPPSWKPPTSSTNPFVPPPTSDQDAPFQRAILLALMPPMLEKMPPTNSDGGLGPGPSSSWLAKAETKSKGSGAPTSPTADHVVPFHRATCPVEMPPMDVNS